MYKLLNTRWELWAHDNYENFHDVKLYTIQSNEVIKNSYLDEIFAICNDMHNFNKLSDWLVNDMPEYLIECCEKYEESGNEKECIYNFSKHIKEFYPSKWNDFDKLTFSLLQHDIEYCSNLDLNFYLIKSTRELIGETKSLSKGFSKGFRA